MLKALGKLPSPAASRAFPPSAQLKDGLFSNVEPTAVMRPDTSYTRLLMQALSRPKTVNPPGVLPSMRVDLHRLDDATPQIVWFGHSSYLISHRGFRVLVDPVLFGTSSPVSFIGKPFAVTERYTVADIPDIDVLVLSHDHYDHLDYVTLGHLRQRVRKVICPLGVSAHLLYWGFDRDRIVELPWMASHGLDADISITALPARHFSGRLITRNRTQWSSYALNLRDYRLFLGGDSGYDQQFRMIGSTYGPFDLAMLECGQYGESWPNIHMFPEETARAAADLQTKQLLPVHWAKFVLANHAWNESIERLVAACVDVKFDVLTPLIGASSTIGVRGESRAWWREVAQG